MDAFQAALDGKRTKPVAFEKKEVDVNSLVKLEMLILHNDQVLVEIPSKALGGKIVAPNEQAEIKDAGAIYSILKIGDGIKEQFALTVEDSLMIEQTQGLTAFKVNRDGQLIQCFLLFAGNIYVGIKGKSEVYFDAIEKPVYQDQSVVSPALGHAYTS